VCVRERDRKIKRKHCCISTASILTPSHSSNACGPKYSDTGDRVCNKRDRNKTTAKDAPTGNSRAQKDGNGTEPVCLLRQQVSGFEGT
jgi:hypothetical protein